MTGLKGKRTVQVEVQTVLIISDEVDFSRRISSRWQMERVVPAFTVLSGELWPRFAVDAFDVAIVGDLRRELLSVVLEPLHSTAHPVFFVCQDDAAAQLVRERWPRVSVLRRTEHWLETLILAASEAVHRSQAEARARAAETYCAKAGSRFMDLRIVSVRKELPDFYHRRGYVETGIEPFAPGLNPKVPCHFVNMSKPLA